MLVGLESQVQHLSRLIALLVNELVANREQSREAGLHDLVKVLSVFGVGRLVSESAAQGEQALETR